LHHFSVDLQFISSIPPTSNVTLQEEEPRTAAVPNPGSSAWSSFAGAWDARNPFDVGLPPFLPQGPSPRPVNPTAGTPTGTGVFAAFTSGATETLASPAANPFAPWGRRQLGDRRSALFRASEEGRGGGHPASEVPPGGAISRGEARFGEIFSAVESQEGPRARQAQPVDLFGEAELREIREVSYPPPSALLLSPPHHHTFLLPAIDINGMWYRDSLIFQKGIVLYSRYRSTTGPGAGFVFFGGLRGGGEQRLSLAVSPFRWVSPAVQSTEGLS